MKNRAFTLIELLVVVLIIGILAAIALPQYQKAVEKSKATQALVMLKTVMQAMDEYYLANGTYTTSFDDLAIDIPFTGNEKFISTGQDSKSNEEWILQLEASSVASSLVAFMVRKSGKYKGAGFRVAFKGPDGIISDKQITCLERKKDANYIFDSSLAEGAYCQQVMGGAFLMESEWTRNYSVFQ